MTTYSELVKIFREKNAKPKGGWRYVSWLDSSDAQQVASLQPKPGWQHAPWQDYPQDDDIPSVQKRAQMKPGGIVEPGVTHYGQLVQPGPGRQGYKYAGPVKLIPTFTNLMKQATYSLDDAVEAVNKTKLKYSPDKIKTYFKNFVSGKRSMSTEEFSTYIKERIKDPSIPHKKNWNKPLMGSPLEAKGFGKRKNVPVSNLIEAEKQLSDEELRLWRAYTKKQQSKAKFARKVAGERIDPVTGDVIKDPKVRSDWLSKAYVRKGIRRAKKSDAYKKLSPLERLKLEFFEKRLDVMGNIIKDNPALLKNKKIMKFLETGVDAKTGKIIRSPVDFSQIKDRRFWELEHIDPIKGGQTKTRGSFLSNVQVLPKSIHKNFKEPAEKFLNENWGNKEYANEINEILKQARELKVTLRVNDVGPVGYKATFENFLDKADDVFNFYVRDSGAKKLYSETIAEMKPANIKFNWKNLGFKEAPSEEIIQKAMTETTRPAFTGIKDGVLISVPATVAAGTATADTGEVTKAGMSIPSAGQLATGALTTSIGSKFTKSDPLKYLRKGIRKVGSSLLTPTGAGALWGATGGFDYKDPLDRAGLAAEAAFAPELVKWTSKLTKPIKNQAVRAGVTQALNLFMTPQMAMKAARIASPIGWVTLGAEGLYQIRKAAQEVAKNPEMLERARQSNLEMARAAEESGVQDVYAKGDELMFKLGGRVLFGKGKVVKGIDKGRRAFMKLLAALGIGTVTAGTGLIKLGGKTATTVEKFKGTPNLVVDITKTPNMPEWYIPVIKKVLNKGDEVTDTAATASRERVHRDILPDGDEVTVTQNIDNQTIDVSVANPKDNYLSASGAGETPYTIQYSKGKVIEEGKYKGQKEADTLEVDEPYLNQVGPDTKDVEIEFNINTYNPKNEVHNTSVLESYATGKKVKSRGTGEVFDPWEGYSPDLKADDYAKGGSVDYDNYLPDIEDIE